MGKNEPLIASSLLESISLLDRARSHGSLRLGDYPAVLWYDPHLLRYSPMGQEKHWDPDALPTLGVQIFCSRAPLNT